MTTLAQLETQISAAVGDTGNTTFSLTVIDTLINQGIDAIGSIYPREIVQTIGTVSAGVTSYSVSSFSHIYRVDIYTSDGSYRMTLPNGIGGADSGWEMHGGVLYLPAGWTFTNGDTLRAWGYGGYVQLSASSSTTDLDTSGIYAVMVFCQSKAFTRLLFDRALFQQWQSNQNGSDVTETALAQVAADYRAEWRDERNRLRKVRK